MNESINPLWTATTANTLYACKNQKIGGVPYSQWLATHLYCSITSINKHDRDFDTLKYKSCLSNKKKLVIVLAHAIKFCLIIIFWL